MYKIACFILSVLLCLATPPCSAETVSSADSDIAWLMELYDFHLPESVINGMHASFPRQIFDCGPVQVELREVLYDGIWLYTSAAVTPTDPGTTLIMPASAGLDDFVAGGHHEKLRKDPRSFQEVAIQDQKEIVCVDVSSTEYSQLAYYFGDHRQDTGEQSTIFSGAPVSWMDEARTFHLSIRLDIIDPSNGISVPAGTYEFPVEVKRVGSLITREYNANEDDIPFNTLRLIQTPLSVYAFPEWKSEAAQSSYRFTLLDSHLISISHGAPPNANTYSLPELPDKLSVQLKSQDEHTRETTVLFSAVDEK